MNGESSTSAVARPPETAGDRERRIAERMAMLLDITQAATSSLELEQILKIAVQKVSQVLPTDRCSVVLVDSPSSTQAVVMATRERDDYRPITIDLSKYPELRRSLQTREATYIEDALEDPLMADVMPAIAPLVVKSILVQPLISQDDLVGALFLRLSKRRGAFGPEEQEFAKAVAAALANSVRNAKLHASVQKKRDDLELAYVERYRELTEANRRLRELARFKDELIAIISHDLRAPLQVTLGHGRMLEDANLPGDLRTSAEAIVRQSRKISEDGRVAPRARQGRAGPGGPRRPAARHGPRGARLRVRAGDPRRRARRHPQGALPGASPGDGRRAEAPRGAAEPHHQRSRARGEERARSSWRARCCTARTARW